MSYIWSFMVLVSLLFGLRNGCIDQVVSAGLEGAKSSAGAVMSLTGVMCLWTGLLKAAGECGISGFIQKLLSPVLHLLFPRLKKASPAFEYISMNVTANLLGMGNGATPMGIKAMEALSDGSGRATNEMCMFAVLNTSAFQLIPSTILALRTGAGASDPASVIIPIWIASLSSLAASVCAVGLISHFTKKKEPLK